MDKWNVGDPSDWGDSIGVPDKAYMGYLNGGNDDDYEGAVESFLESMRMKSADNRLKALQKSAQRELDKINSR